MNPIASRRPAGHRTIARSPAPAPPHPHQPWSVLILLSVAQFMVILDVTVVNVALPSIGAALGFTPGGLQWVVTAYVLFTGSLLLLGGRAADLLGSRRVFLAGLLVFTAASLASGLAPTPTALITARAAQGIGAALLTPAALSIITTTYTGARRSTALSVWGAIGGGGAAAGVLFGGMLTTWLSWEWVFFINVPVGVLVGIFAVRLVRSAPPVGAGYRHFDIPGAMSAVAGLVLLVYALQGTTDHGWASARTLLLLAASAGLLASFIAIERSSARPLVPPRTWRVRSLIAGAAVMLGATGILVGTFFLNSLYLQNVLGASALGTGLAFLPLALVIAVAAHLASRLLPHAGSRTVVVAGLALMAAGALILSFAPDQATYATNLLPGFLILGAGVGLVFPAVSVTAMSEIHAEGAGLASGLMTSAHEIGAALGVAVLSAVAAANGGTAAGPGFAIGYGDGFLAAALIATFLALIAMLALPAVRPAVGSGHAAMH